MKKNNQKGLPSEEGQSMILLLFSVILSVAITTLAIMMLVINSGSVGVFETGVEAKQIAESGMEKALLELIRDPAYLGESYQMGEGQVNTTISGSNPKTINVSVTLGDSTKTVEVLANYTNNVLQVTSWKEIY